MGDLVASANALINNLAKRSYATVHETFDDTMKEAMTLEGLELMWTQQIIGQVGELKEVGEHKQVEHEGAQIVLVKTNFERGKLVTRVVFDSDGKVAGLGFQPQA